MIDPPRWSLQELQAAIEAARNVFRKERLEEPLQDYLDTFDAHQRD